jgi:hypothetical protein
MLNEAAAKSKHKPFLLWIFNLKPLSLKRPCVGFNRSTQGLLIFITAVLLQQSGYFMRFFAFLQHFRHIYDCPLAVAIH